VTGFRDSAWKELPGSPGLQTPLSVRDDFVISHHGIAWIIPVEYREAYLRMCEEHGQFYARENTPFVQSRDPDQFVVSYRPPNEHNHVGEYPTLDAAKGAAERYANGSRCTCASPWTYSETCDLHATGLRVGDPR
jgi:hypothetical protein